MEGKTNRVLAEYPPMTVGEFKARLPEIAEKLREAAWEHLREWTSPEAILDRLLQKLARNEVRLEEAQVVRVKVVDGPSGPSVEYALEWRTEGGVECGAGADT